MLKWSEKGYRFVDYDFFQNLVTWYPPSEKIHVFYIFFQFFRVFIYLLGLQMHFSGQTLCSFVNFNPYILIRSKFAYKLVKIVSKHPFLCVFMRFLPFFDIFLYFFALKFPKSHQKLYESLHKFRLYIISIVLRLNIR